MSDPLKPDRAAVDALILEAEDGASSAMRKIRQVPQTFLAARPSGLLTLISTMSDEQQRPAESAGRQGRKDQSRSHGFSRGSPRPYRSPESAHRMFCIWNSEWYG